LAERACPVDAFWDSWQRWFVVGKGLRMAWIRGAWVRVCLSSPVFSCMRYDVIVFGLGAMGSAAAMHLAARGRKVLGIDQFRPPHDQGSSHGGTRMIRQGYGEGADYIPLVLRAYELWEELEREAGTKLLFVTGGLILGPADGMVRRAAAAADRHAIPYEVLSGSETNQRFPAIVPLAGDVALLETRAGYLLPEACVRAHLQRAATLGAELRFDEPVVSWTADAGGVQVRTAQSTYTAERLVIAAGPWAQQALGNVVPLRVTRQVMAWIRPRGRIDAFLPGRLPVFLSECEDGRPAYGFPAVDGAAGGVKAAVHGSEETCTPETVDRGIRESDRAEILRKVSLRMPALAGEIVKAQICLYTMTPDEHFVIGLHPEYPAVSIACGFSGHGFKFATVVGEILADLAIEGETRHPIGMFSPLRFARS